MRHIDRSPFTLLKELWISYPGSDANTTFDLLALQLLVIDQESTFIHGLANMLGPEEGVVTSPYIATIEVRGYVRLADFAEVLRARADAVCRPKKSRMKG